MVLENHIEIAFMTAFLKAIAENVEMQRRLITQMIVARHIDRNVARRNMSCTEDKLQWTEIFPFSWCHVLEPIE